MRHTGWCSSARCCASSDADGDHDGRPTVIGPRRPQREWRDGRPHGRLRHLHFTADYCTSVMPTDCEWLNANGTQGIDFASRSSGSWPRSGQRRVPVSRRFSLVSSTTCPADQGYIPAYAPCGPAPLELKDAGWPETGFGDLVAYGAPVYAHIFQFYWFAVYVDPGGGNYFGTRTYPSTDEAAFVDDGNPPVLDLTYELRHGALGRHGSQCLPEPAVDRCVLLSRLSL